jgi:hypothetical protein
LVDPHFCSGLLVAPKVKIEAWEAVAWNGVCSVANAEHILLNAIDVVANFAKHAAKSHLVNGISLSVGKDVLVLVEESKKRLKCFKV